MPSRKSKIKKPAAERPTVVVWVSLMRDIHAQLSAEAGRRGESLAAVLRRKIEAIYAA